MKLVSIKPRRGNQGNRARSSPEAENAEDEARTFYTKSARQQCVLDIPRRLGAYLTVLLFIQKVPQDR